MTSENPNDNQVNRIEAAENQQHQNEEEKWKLIWSVFLWWYKITLWLRFEKRSKVFVAVESLAAHYVAVAVGYVWDCGGADWLFKKKGLDVQQWNEVTLTNNGNKPLSIELKTFSPLTVVCPEPKQKLDYNRISRYSSDYLQFLLHIERNTVETVYCAFTIGQTPEAAALSCRTRVPRANMPESQHSTQIIDNRNRTNSPHGLTNSTNRDQIDFENETQRDLISTSRFADSDAENTTNSTVTDNSNKKDCNEVSQHRHSANACPLSKCVSGETMAMLSRKLGDSARDVGRQLRLTEADLQNIQQRHPNEFAYYVLDKWKQNNGEFATNEGLFHALHCAYRRDLRDEMFAYIMENDHVASH